MREVHIPAEMSEQLGISRSEARRLIDTGAVTLDGACLSAGEHDATLIGDRTMEFTSRPSGRIAARTRTETRS